MSFPKFFKKLLPFNIFTFPFSYLVNQPPQQVRGDKSGIIINHYSFIFLKASRKLLSESIMNWLLTTTSSPVFMPEIISVIPLLVIPVCTLIGWNFPLPFAITTNALMFTAHPLQSCKWDQNLYEKAVTLFSLLA